MVELTEQERKCEKSVAEAFGSLSLGLWSVALIGYLTSGVTWATYFLVVVGAIFTVFGIYFILPWEWDWKQKQCLKSLEAHPVMKVTKSLGWFIVLAIFGVGLIQSKVGWLIVIGLIAAITSYAIFLVGLSGIGKDIRKEK